MQRPGGRKGVENLSDYKEEWDAAGADGVRSSILEMILGEVARGCTMAGSHQGLKFCKPMDSDAGL